MITVVVKFPIPTEISPETYKEKMVATVPKYQNIPGLMRKNYIFDKNLQIGGAVYNFENLEDAKTCFNEDFIERVSTNFGKPDISYFNTLIEVDNLSNTVKINDD